MDLLLVSFFGSITSGQTPHVCRTYRSRLLSTGPWDSIVALRRSSLTTVIASRACPQLPHFLTTLNPSCAIGCQLTGLHFSSAGTTLLLFWCCFFCHWTFVWLSSFSPSCWGNFHCYLSPDTSIVFLQRREKTKTLVALLQLVQYFVETTFRNNS